MRRRLPEFALLVVGFLVIVAGIIFMFMHQQYEADFQSKLLKVYSTDYHWRSVGGGSYSGLGALIVGALMMALSGILMTRQAAPGDAVRPQEFPK